MTIEEIKSSLCYYDLRNPDGVNCFNRLSDEEKKDYKNSHRKNCSCDNCFYGKTKLAEELLKILKTK